MESAGSEVRRALRPEASAKVNRGTALRGAVIIRYSKNGRPPQPSGDGPFVRHVTHDRTNVMTNANDTGRWLRIQVFSCFERKKGRGVNRVPSSTYVG